MTVTPFCSSRLPPNNTLSALSAFKLLAVNCKLVVSARSWLLTTLILVELISTFKPAPPATLLPTTMPSSASLAASTDNLPTSLGRLTFLPPVLSGSEKNWFALVKIYCEGAFETDPVAGRKTDPLVTLKVDQVASRAPVPKSAR